VSKATTHRGSASEPLSLQSLSTWSKTWLPGFVKPGVSSFREVLRPGWANAKVALALVGIGGLMSSTAAQVSVLLRPGSPEPAWMIGDSPPGRILLTGLTFLFSFIIEVAVIQFIAWIFGGRGTFTELAFLMAVYAAPIDVLASLISAAYGSSLAALPILCVLPIYSFALRYAAIRAVHRLSPGPTLLALLPAGLVAACATVAIWLATFPWPQPVAGPAM